MSTQIIDLNGTTTCRDSDGYEVEISADDCQRCEVDDLYMEYDRDDSTARIVCRSCERTGVWNDTERDCGDCDECGQHYVECDRHGRELSCECSCVDDTCECSCCLQSHAFLNAATSWNSGDAEKNGAPWCRDCAERDADCECSDTICGECEVRPCECDPDACGCEVHEGERTKPAAAAAKEAADVWENT